MVKSVQCKQYKTMARSVLRQAAPNKAPSMLSVAQGLLTLQKAPAIVIGEGYATADTLSQALGYATVAAFDSGNLPSVASLLRDKFPDKPFIIAGDNDLHLGIDRRP